MPIGPIFAVALFLLFPCVPKPTTISNGDQEGPGEDDDLSVAQLLSTLP
jgi:hypothetical protein